LTNRIIVGVIFFSIIFAACVQGAGPNALCFTCDFMEKYQDSAWRVVDSRSFVAPLAQSFQFSMGNFSYRLQPDTMNVRAVRIESQVNCFDSRQRNFFDDKIVLRGASLFFDSALVRGSSYYRIRLTFDSLGHVESGCQFKYTDSSFSSDPSGKYEFFYIKRSLGDYRWNQIRDAFEFDYKKIAPIYDLKDQSRINFFIAPCEAPDIGWDPRWQNAIDFSRNNVFALYSHEVNQLFMDVVLMLRFVRNWGYTPALLLEGAAAAPDFCDLFAKQSLKDGKLPDLTTISVTATYRALDRGKAATTAGSFVNYLLKTRGMAKFRDFYEQSTDLTIPQVCRQIYGASLTSIESEWRAYLDSVSLSPSLYGYHIDRARTFMHIDDMLFYAQKGLAATNDTATFGEALAGLYFTFGDYTSAAKFFRYQTVHLQTTATPEVFLANMLLAQGEIAPAESLYLQVTQHDTSDTYALVKLAQIRVARKEPLQAIEMLRSAAVRNRLPANGIDIDLGLGDAFAAAGQTDSAGAHYQAALDHSKLMISSSSDNPLNHLRAARAALRLGSGRLALDYLETAFFLEERMFYLGQILLAMGEAHDVLGERKAAIEQYRKVLKFPTAYLDRQEAEKHLQTAYHN
jgi:tetratricopeptide (TPR) repeat protein